MTGLILPAATYGKGYVDPTFAQISSRLTEGPVETAAEALPINSFIDLMNPHIRESHHATSRSFAVVSDNLGVYQDTDYEEYARLLCGAANSLKLTANAAGESEAPAASTHAHPAFSPADRGIAVSYWWGLEIKMNGPLTNDVLFGIATGLGASTIAAGVTAVIPGGQVASAALGIVAGMLTLYAGALTWAMGKCNNQGAVVNASWLSLTTPWITAVC